MLNEHDLHEPLEVHQAVGMVLVQAGVSADEALARLRERAARNDQPLLEVARAVTSRRLPFD